MKKILSLVFMVAAMMYATSANAQVKFGLKGGLNVTSMSFSEDVFDASNKTGFFVGPMVKVTVPIVGLSFDAAALYDQKEADVKYVGTDGELGQANVKQQSINIPVNVRYGFGLSSVANIFLFAGPQWGINVGDKNFKWNEDKQLFFEEVKLQRKRRCWCYLAEPSSDISQLTISLVASLLMLASLRPLMQLQMQERTRAVTTLGRLHSATGSKLL